MNFIRKRKLSDGRDLKIIETNCRYSFLFFGHEECNAPETMEIVDNNTDLIVLSLSKEEDIFIHKYDHEGRIIEKRSIDGGRSIRYYYNDEGEIAKSVDVMDTIDDFPLVTVEKYKDGEVISRRTFVPDTEEIVED